MKLKIGFGFLSLLLPVSGFTQTTADYAVRLEVEAQVSPPALQFSWPADPGATQYQFFRKALGSTTWSSVLATLPGTDSVWVDTNIQLGESYEYKCFKQTPSLNAYGYAYGGIQLPAVESRGILLLVMDSTFKTSLASEIQLLREDLSGDGWTVHPLFVDRNDTPPTVRSLIQAEYNADPAWVKGVFLLGHVPVPYSGNLNPDGHPDHQGAWPADVYYGEMTSGWNDATINNTAASRPENQNIPGDGKFDASTLPSDVELWVGRVDMANLPIFGVGEEELLRRYLAKDHAWRMGQVSVTQRVVVDDNFGVFAGPPLENFASAGWRLAPLVGKSNQTWGDFLTESMGGNSSLWLYGCGPGSYNSAAGVVTSPDFAVDSLSSVFSMIFGSYHGDWDNQNALLRCALASKGSLLTTAWAGRPQWHFHPMGLGVPIGFCARMSQNNSTTYMANYGARMIHIALMGDPTLRQQVLAPPSDLVATAQGRDVLLAWTPSPDSVAGYWLYKAPTSAGPFVRITQDTLLGTSFLDACTEGGGWTYMVRALALEEGPSGSFWNLSQGVMDTTFVDPALALGAPIFAPTQICAGDSLSLSFNVGGNWCTGNTFGVELSTSVGSFTTPLVLGTTATSSITVFFPDTLSAGTAYLLRIHALAPDSLGPVSLPIQVIPQPQAIFYTQTNGLLANFLNGSLGATSYFWDFGDGGTSTLQQPLYQYPAAGTYSATLIATNACGSDTLTQTVTLNGVGRADPFSPAWVLFPNPAVDRFVVAGEGMESLEIFDLLQRKIGFYPIRGTEIQISTQTWEAGAYTVVVQGKAGTKTFLLLRQ